MTIVNNSFYENERNHSEISCCYRLINHRIFYPPSQCCIFISCSVVALEQSTANCSQQIIYKEDKGGNIIFTKTKRIINAFHDS